MIRRDLRINNRISFFFCKFVFLYNPTPMKNLQKVLGLLFILVAILAEYFLIAAVFNGALVKDPASNIIFGATVIPVSIPIMIGLGLFGYYAWKGEYATDN